MRWIACACVLSITLFSYFAQAQEPSKEALREKALRFVNRSIVLAESDNSGTRRLGWGGIHSQLTVMLTSALGEVPEAEAKAIERLYASKPSPDALLAMKVLYQVTPKLRLSRMGISEKSELADALFYIAWLVEFETRKQDQRGSLAEAIDELKLEWRDDARHIIALGLSREPLSQTQLDALSKSVSIEVPKDGKPPLLSIAAALLAKNDRKLANLLYAKIPNAPVIVEDFLFTCAVSSDSDPLRSAYYALSANEVYEHSTSRWSLNVGKLFESLGVEKYDGVDDKSEKSSFATKMAANTRWFAVKKRTAPTPPYELTHAEDLTANDAFPNGSEFRNRPMPLKAVSNDGEIRCLVGCLTQTAAAIEPSSGWSVFTVIPGFNKKVELAILSDRKPSYASGIVVKSPLPEDGWRGKDKLYEYFISPDLEVLEFDPGRLEEIPLLENIAAVDLFGPVKSHELNSTTFKAGWEKDIPKLPGEMLRNPQRSTQSSPTVASRKMIPAIQSWQKAFNEHTSKFVTHTKTSMEFGLLGYVSSMIRHIDGWLIRSDKKSQIEDAALQAFARVMLLHEIQVTSQKDTREERSSAPYKARAQFLRQAIPIMVLAVDRHFGAEVERKIQTLAKLRTNLHSAWSKVYNGLTAFKSLSQDDGFALLEYSATDVLKIEKPNVQRDKQALLTALLGLEDQLSTYLEEVKRSLLKACYFKKTMRFSGTAMIPKIELDEAILQQCEAK